jgi:hypothetical protein
MGCGASACAPAPEEAPHIVAWRVLGEGRQGGCGGGPALTPDAARGICGYRQGRWPACVTAVGASGQLVVGVPCVAQPGGRMAVHMAVMRVGQHPQETAAMLAGMLRGAGDEGVVVRGMGWSWTDAKRLCVTDAWIPAHRSGAPPVLSVVVAARQDASRGPAATNRPCT